MFDPDQKTFCSKYYKLLFIKYKQKYPFIRWSMVWMFKALTETLVTLSK
jgi:hypothetical protein